MNIFLVESPTQALNAIEAKQRFCLEVCHLYVLLTGLFSRAVYERVIDHSNWTSVVYVDFRFIARDFDFGKNRPANLIERMIEIATVLDLFRKRAQIDRLARRLGNAKRLFLGQYRLDTRQYFRHFANVCPHEELFLLDDGTDTVLINNQRREEAYEIKARGQIISKNRIKRAIKDKFGTWDTTGVDSLVFFTSLRIDVNRRDRIIDNDYRCLRSLVRLSTVEQNRVFFLGQTLVDDTYMTLENYLEVLGRVRERFRAQKFLYVAHPRESQNSTDAVARRLGVQVCRFDVPIELEMTVHGNRPEIVAGFFCSALENCARMFDKEIEVQAYRIDSRLLLKQHEEVENVYAHLKTVGAVRILEP